MIPCISQLTTLNTPLEDELPAFAGAGWPAVELWLTKLEESIAASSVGEVKRRLDDAGLKVAAAAGQGGLLQSSGPERESHRDHYRRRLEWLQILEVPTIVLAPNFPQAIPEEELKRAVEALGDAAQLAAAHGVKVALEPYRSDRFAASLDTAIALVAQVGDANAGICLDLFHYYTGPSKFEDLAYLNPSNLFHVQLNDLGGTPREVATEFDRILPGEGDFQIGPILEHLGRVGYQGFVSLEVSNLLLWRAPAVQVAALALRALLRTFESAGLSLEASGGAAP